MSNNLFVSYDLFAPGQSYDKVAEAIRALGPWAKIQKSFWYVKSPLSASQAHQRVWAVMDANDSLIAVDATNNDASWTNVKPEVAAHLKDFWRK